MSVFYILRTGGSTVITIWLCVSNFTWVLWFFPTDSIYIFIVWNSTGTSHFPLNAQTQLLTDPCLAVSSYMNALDFPFFCFVTCDVNFAPRALIEWTLKWVEYRFRFALPSGSKPIKLPLGKIENLHGLRCAAKSFQVQVSCRQPISRQLYAHCSSWRRHGVRCQASNGWRGHVGPSLVPRCAEVRAPRGSAKAMQGKWDASRPCVKGMQSLVPLEVGDNYISCTPLPCNRPWHHCSVLAK